MTPTETGSPTCHVATSEDKVRNFVDFLLDDGEQTALMDALAIDTDTEDIDDVTGWGCSVSLPRPPLYETRRAAVNPPPGGSLGGFRRKSYKQKESAPEMDLSNMRVRCVNEDFSGDHQKFLWKANVEPGTYRYISNNGIYRSTKFANTGSDWVTAKRSRHIENNISTNNPEIKLAQKSLRKDLDNHFKLAENNIRTENGHPPSTPSHKMRDPRHHHPYHHHQENNVESKQSSSTSNNLAKGDSDSLPPPSRPPKDPKLVKSASDLFVENFSSRISALEKSEKETNSNTPIPRTPCSPQKSGMSLNNNNNKRQGDPHGADAVDDISKDVFTVRPVTRAPDVPLGPLEKLTPQQKLLERASDSECSSHQTKSQPESPTLPPSFMTAMNAFAQIHNKSTIHQHSHRNKDNRSHPRSNPNTHRHPYKSSSMSNVSDPDSSINSVRNALTLTNSNIERMRMGSYGKSPIKDYGRFLSSTRPKVAPQSTHTSAFGRMIGTSSNAINNTNSSHGFGGGPGLIGSNIHKNAVVGYKSLSTSAPVTHGAMMRPSNNLAGMNVQPVVTSTLQVEDVSCGVSETESYLSGTSLNVNRGSSSLRDGKTGMALPEISGKRMAVATTTQRML